MNRRALALLLITGCTGTVGAPEPEAQPIASSIDEARTRCGDGICERRERCDTCPQDCGMCPAPPPDAGITDSGTPPPPADAGIADSGAPPAGPDCRSAATWPAAWVAFEDETLTLVNQRRAQGAVCGSTTYAPAGPLAASSALREAARCHSLDMAANNYFDHTSLDGSSPWDRIARASYTGSARAENIAAGYSTPSAVVSGWMGSSGHCANIMSAGSNEIGIGYAFTTSSTYRHYWTQDFGVR